MKYYLKSCHNNHNPLEIPDDTPVIFGRSPQTKISDKKCSRHQIELTANYAKETITLKQLGSNSSYVGDEEIYKGKTYTLNIDEIFYFCGKDYAHKITKDNVIQDKLFQKRKIDSIFGIKSCEDNKPELKKQKISTSKKETGNDEILDAEETDIAKKLTALKEKRFIKNQEPMIKSSLCNNPPYDRWQTSVTSSGWTEHDGLLIFHSPGLFDSSKVAAFDMDGTLITTASGRTFPKDSNDWKILYCEVPGKLKSLHKENCKIVIITNQLGIGRGKISAVDFQTKVGNIIRKLGVPVQVIAITKRGLYRKPNIGSWTWLQAEGNGRVEIDMKSSFYVGDAAGRPKDWAPKKKKDFSCTDRLFAINLGISFSTPEEFFLSQKTAKHNMPKFNPKDLSTDALLTLKPESLTIPEQEVVVLVGYPASGKSFFAKEYLVSKGYYHVNRDAMKTWQKCVSACNNALTRGKSVVIDNTNPDIQSRKRYIDCAKNHRCKCRCFVMQVTMEHAMHNNRFRQLSESDHDPVPDMVFHQYNKLYKEPSEGEGFSNIIQLNFIPKFNDDDTKRKYFMFNG